MNMNNSRAPYSAYNNAELIRMVDNSNDATPMERELAERLDETMIEVQMLEHEVRRFKAVRENFEKECG